jgi:putative endonuclease
LASERNGTLYIGVTNDLVKRVWQHKNHVVKGFTAEYGVDKLVYYETTPDIESAIKREKNLKAWQRKWKLRLIEEFNNDWEDLYNNLL